MPLITKEELEHAELDAATLSAFINSPADVNGTGIITSRLGQEHKVLAKIIEEIVTVADAPAIPAKIAALETEVAANIEVTQVSTGFPPFVDIAFTERAEIPLILADFIGGTTEELRPTVTIIHDVTTTTARITLRRLDGTTPETATGTIRYVVIGALA